MSQDDLLNHTDDYYSPTSVANTTGWQISDTPVLMVSSLALLRSKPGQISLWK